MNVYLIILSIICFLPQFSLKSVSLPTQAAVTTDLRAKSTQIRLKVATLCHMLNRSKATRGSLTPPLQIAAQAESLIRELDQLKNLAILADEAIKPAQVSQ